MMISYPTDGVFLNIEDPLGRREVIPRSGGLYLVGNTIFNPLTGEQFFMVKVGMSTNLYNRMRGYSTENPMLFHIGYKVINCDNIDVSKYPTYKRTNAVGRYIKSIEEQYHKELEAHKFGRFEYAQEWFIVDKATYMEICEKKFDFFNIKG